MSKKILILKLLYQYKPKGRRCHGYPTENGTLVTKLYQDSMVTVMMNNSYIAVL